MAHDLGPRNRPRFDETITDPVPEEAPAPEPQNGRLVTVLAIPLAPFVGAWEAGRILVTRVVPGIGRRVWGTLSAAGRTLRPAVGVVMSSIVAGVNAVARLAAMPFRAMGRLVRAVARRVAAVTRAVATVCAGWPDRSSPSPVASTSPYGP